MTNRFQFLFRDTRLGFVSRCLNVLPTLKPRSRGLAPAPGVSAAVDGGTLALFNTATGRVFVANHVGAHIWDALSRGDSMLTVAASIGHDYGVGQSQALHDVKAFVAALSEQQLVVGGIVE